MGDVKEKMNMCADDISVSGMKINGKFEKMKNSEEQGQFRQNGRKQAEKNGSWMHLEIDSHSTNEEFARVTAAVFMSRMNPTMEELEDVKTAVSEAVTNAVIHGYGDEIGIIYIEAQIEGDELTISIRDEGRGIPDVEKAMEPMYTTDTTGERSGMGFSFMEAFMDEVEVESKVGQGTRVRMRKRIGKKYDRETGENDWAEKGEEQENQVQGKMTQEPMANEEWKRSETADFYG